jgi:F0F1-type ATP synthase delta subunit
METPRELIEAEKHEIRIKLKLAVSIMKKRKQIQYMESEILNAARNGRIAKIRGLCKQYRLELDELENQSKVAPFVPL